MKQIPKNINWDATSFFERLASKNKLAKDVTSDDSYWNYYGSLRLLKDFIKKHGGNKDIYLTEVYALDWPNCWWNDTPRSATSNIVLSYARWQRQRM